jgi:hypothetical protein
MCRFGLFSRPSQRISLTSLILQKWKRFQQHGNITNNPIRRPRKGSGGLLIPMKFSGSHSKSKLYIRTHRPCNKILGGIIKNIKRNS